MLSLIRTIPNDRPVLIAGPTASGKSALALAIAGHGGGRIVNADALQVFAAWSVLTARPGPADLARAPHVLYGHVGWEVAYSVGDWLREVASLLDGPRPIIVGGTGLYFRALTEGLADIPTTPAAVRKAALARLDSDGLASLVADLAPPVRAAIDTANPMRVMRAWEVARATGRSILDWQAETPPPLIALEDATALVLDAPKSWLDPRIDRRFDAMLSGGALDEVSAVLPRWDDTLNAAQAIGARDLVGHLRGELTLAEARDRATIATRQYAKRQRTWFKNRMKSWQWVDASRL
ncbi:MAG: tRNA (adenosine(37)-N6)-dimethylallyltransferase MiaA [Jannaschia sp.]